MALAPLWNLTTDEWLEHIYRDMSRRREHVLTAPLTTLLHLLKWAYQPQGRSWGHAWIDSLRATRDVRRKLTVDPAWWLEEDVPVAESVEILGVEVDSVDLPAPERHHLVLLQKRRVKKCAGDFHTEIRVISFPLAHVGACVKYARQFATSTDLPELVRSR